MATGVRMIILRDAAGVATEAEVVVDMAVEVVVGMAAEVEVSAVEEEVTAWEVWGPDFATSTGTLILCRNSKRCDYESFVVLVLFYCCTDNSSSRRCLICNTLYRTYVEGIYRERLTYVDSSIHSTVVVALAIIATRTAVQYYCCPTCCIYLVQYSYLSYEYLKCCTLDRSGTATSGGLAGDG